MIDVTDTSNLSRREQLFLKVHSGLPREGPGNRECTARALALAAPLPAAPRVLDIACGPGMQTLDLADLLPTAQITAIDGHAPYVEETRRRAAAAGCDNRVTCAVGDMRKLNFEPGSFDLIWCEGAAYIMGVENALQQWRPLLADGGRLAFSEAVWLLTDQPPERVRACWDEYPAMTDVAGNRQRVQAAGYTLLGDFVLAPQAWWTYYNPMQQRIEMLQQEYAGDSDAQAMLAEHLEEIDVYRQHGEFYGYVFTVAAVD